MVHQRKMGEVHFLNGQNSLGIRVFVVLKEGLVCFLFHDFRGGVQIQFPYSNKRSAPTP